VLYVSKKNPGRYVTRAEFQQAIDPMKDDLKTLKRALVGEDLQHGIVKDVADIKSALKTASALKNIIVPIIIAVASSLITAALLGKLPIP